MIASQEAAVGLAVMGLVTLGALGLAGWCCWLLHRHWPKSDAAFAKEFAAMLWTAEQRGRGADLPTAAEDLDASAARDRAMRDAEAWRMAQDEPPPQKVPYEDRPQTVVTVGTGPTEAEV